MSMKRMLGVRPMAAKVTLAKSTQVRAWAVPQLSFREAAKQRGSYLVVPEQGMRLQAAARDGVTQLDPQKSGITQKGVLAFRVLQTPWSLGLDIEQVEFLAALVLEPDVDVTRGRRGLAGQH